MENQERSILRQSLPKQSSSPCCWASWMEARLLGDSLTVRMELESSFDTCLCVKVEACDTNKWVPHGRNTQKQVSSMKEMI